MRLKSIYDNLAVKSPRVEVFLRKVYWKSDFLIGLYRNKPQAKPVETTVDKIPVGKIFENMKINGIGSGDLIIVHSGYGEIKRNCSDLKKPSDIIDGLIDLIGDEGTLAFPTHPEYKTEKINKNLINKDTFDEITYYNVKETKAWTGVLPNTFLTYSDVIRSRHPINSMAALGPYAHDMMKNNLAGEKPLPCGVNSSWKYCAENNAKIVGLGVDLVHALTMIHVAEDCNVETWPVEGWYRDRRFNVQDADFNEKITVRERKPKWGSLYFAEKNLRKDLIASGILKAERIGELRMEYIENSKDLVAFLNARNHSGYPYYIKLKK